MSPPDDESDEFTHLLSPRVAALSGKPRQKTNGHQLEDVESIISSHLSKDEQAMGHTATGERLAYNDYTTIDWLHDLTKDSFRHRALRSKGGLKGKAYAYWDASQGWVASVMIGVFTAVVAYLVDVAVVTVADYKSGHCTSNIFHNRAVCCAKAVSTTTITNVIGEECSVWHEWSENYGFSFAAYVAFAVLFGVIAGSVTMTTKSNLPAVSSEDESSGGKHVTVAGKAMYMAAGSGIPEIKTILSGFVIPNFLDFKVLVVKAVGSTFAVATGMCLGKEGPFVHISTCAGYLVARLFPKYRDNGRKMREMLSVACSSGLSVAFGAPIGGVLFSYEEISTYFPRKVLWRAFLCSLTAAIVLKYLNPTGTGKLVLFETNYGVDYQPIHYLVFIFLGIAGGVFGGIFCKANYLWSKSFRKYSVIKDHPVFELALVVLVTALLQYPNPMTRQPGDVILETLLIDCKHPEGSWICEQEASQDKSLYYGWLAYGTLVKLFLTIITFGCKVPSGIIIPALDAGAFFGRLIAQVVPGISPGIFAMVGAVAFLAGVSRMTVSLAVIAFELTGEVAYTPAFMIAILVAKWVADSITKESVYDLAQSVLGHPFLDPEHALSAVRVHESLVRDLIPPAQTMGEITVTLPTSNIIPKALLITKLSQLRNRGIMDAGLVLVNAKGILHGYLAQAELEFILEEDGILGDGENEEVDILAEHVSQFIDRTPLTLSANAPMEYAVEMFGKLGLRYLIVTEESTARVVGVIIKKRLVLYLEGLQH